MKRINEKCESTRSVSDEKDRKYFCCLLYVVEEQLNLKISNEDFWLFRARFSCTRVIGNPYPLLHIFDTLNLSNLFRPFNVALVKKMDLEQMIILQNNMMHSNAT